MNLLKTKALVLHEMPVSDQDKRLILLTKDFGKITAFAGGARKSNSSLLAGSQIFSYGDYLLYKGKQAYNVKQVQLIETFHTLRDNMDSLTYGLYLLEFIQYISQEDNPDTQLMRLTLKALKQIEKRKIDIRLVVGIFELKAMSLMGFAPWVSNCCRCQSDKDLYGFNVRKGGVICKNCLSAGDITSEKMEVLIYTIEYILNAEVDQLFTFTLDQDVLKTLTRVVKDMRDIHLNKIFKTLEFLKLGLS